MDINKQQTLIDTLQQFYKEKKNILFQINTLTCSIMTCSYINGLCINNDSIIINTKNLLYDEPCDNICIHLKNIESIHLVKKDELSIEVKFNENESIVIMDAEYDD